MVFFFNYRDRGVVLILIFCAALIPTSMIADLNPPMDLGFFFALNLLFAAIAAYPFARYCERNKTRKIYDPKTEKTAEVQWRDEFFRIPVKYWPYLFLAGSVACVVGSLNPGAETFRERGKAYRDKDKYDLAIDAYTSAIKLDPYDYQAFNGRGVSYANRRDYDHGIADFTEAIRLKPDYAAAFVNRGYAYEAKGDHDRAIADLTEAIKLNPKFAEAFNDRGLAYSHKGEYDRAIADYTEATRLKLNYAAAFYNRGLAYTKKGEYGAAIADFTEAIRFDHNDARAFRNRGLAYDYKGEYDRAIADYTEAVRHNPKYAMAFNDRGILYMDKGEYDHAITDFTEAIGLDPQFAMALRMRGYTYFFKGNFSAAAEDMRRANEIAVHPYVMLWRSIARARVGEDGVTELAANADQLKSKDWPYAVIDMWLGRRTLDKMRDAASTPEQKCEAAYYSAEWYLVHDQRTQAQAGLQEATGLCSKTSVEYEGAVEELKRLRP